jgi:hypothetical protein
MADGKPLVVAGGLTAIRVVDWNADGNFDLVCDGFGGGVYLYLNTGKPGQTAFGAPEVLIPPKRILSPKRQRGAAPGQQQ